MISRKHAALAAVTALAAPSALASVSVQTLRPVTNTSYVLVEDALMESAPRDADFRKARLSFGAQYNWVNDPLVEFNPDRTAEQNTLVDGVSTLDLMVGGFFSTQPGRVKTDLSVHANVPLNLVQMKGKATAFALGDISLQGKYRLVEAANSPVAISVIPEIRLPTGDRDLMLSSGRAGFGMLFAFERDLGPVRASAHIGYRYQPGAQFRQIDYRQQLPIALGILAPLGKGWSLNAEAAGAPALPLNRFNNPGEGYLGMRYQIARGTSATGGVGIGSITGSGSGDVRIVAGLKFSLDGETSQRRAVYAAPVTAARPAPVVARNAVITKPVARPVARSVVRQKPRVVGAVGATGAPCVCATEKQPLRKTAQSPAARPCASSNSRTR